MNELKTLQEEEIAKYKEEFIAYNNIPYATVERNGIPCNAGSYHIFALEEAIQKSFTLGLMKGVEMVEGVVPKERSMIGTGTYQADNYYNDCRSEILSNITKLKQELK